MCTAPLLAAQASSSEFPAAGSSTARQIQAVEDGLRGPVAVKGEPLHTHTLAASMQDHHVQAVSVAVMLHGKLAWAKGYGIRRAGGSPVQSDTLFQAASISKSLTAMAVLRLVEGGKLSLDAPVQTELKSWTLPAGKQDADHPVTLRELLSHTAGTNVHGFPGYATTEPVPSLTQVLDGTKPANTEAIRVTDVPGAAFSYSGGGYTIVQQILIDTMGEAFPKILHDLVLAPDGMTRSAYQQPLSSALLSNAALPVDGNGKPIAGGPHTYPELAAAGLWTTPSDLVRWMADLLASYNGQPGHVLTQASARLMVTPIKEGYGLGTGTHAPGDRDPVLFSHTGGNAGYGCIYFALPDGDGAVIMTDGDNGFDVYTELLRSLASVYGWTGFASVERTAIPLDPKAVAPYLGHFKGEHGPAFTLSLRGDRLFFEHDGQEQTLRPSPSNIFFMTDGASAIQLRFDSPDKGAVLFPEGSDTFTRQP